MVYYHATPTTNNKSIQEEGIKRNRHEKVIFLTDNEEEAIKFLAVRLYPDITVYTIELPEEMEAKLEESFDHNPTYFKCKAYMCPEDIPVKYIKKKRRWRRPKSTKK